MYLCTYILMYLHTYTYILMYLHIYILTYNILQIVRQQTFSRFIIPKQQDTL